MNKQKKAELAYTVACRLNRRNFTGFDNLGNLYNELGRIDEAEKSWLQAIEINNESPQVYMKLSYLQAFFLNKPDEAEKSAKKMIEIAPKISMLWSHLGFIQLHLLNDMDGAQISLKKSIELGSESGFGYNNLGDLYCYYLDDLNKATVFYDQAVTDEIVDRVVCKAIIAYALLCIDKWPIAVGHVKYLLNISPDSFPEGDWTLFVKLCRQIVIKNRIREFLEIMDETAAHDQWRPVREAMAAISVKSLRPLNGVAPEIRVVYRNDLTRSRWEQTPLPGRPNMISQAGSHGWSSCAPFAPFILYL